MQKSLLLTAGILGAIALSTPAFASRTADIARSADLVASDSHSGAAFTAGARAGHDMPMLQLASRDGGGKGDGGGHGNSGSHGKGDGHGKGHGGGHDNGHGKGHKGSHGNDDGDNHGKGHGHGGNDD